MKPSRLLLAWVTVLLALNLLLGTLRAFDLALPASTGAIAWGLLLGLLLIALLDALLVWRVPALRVRRSVPGSLALGRLSEVQLHIEHDLERPLSLLVFDHPPAGLAPEHLPQALELEPGVQAQLTYRVRPARRGHFQFERCELQLVSRLGLWRQRRYVAVSTVTRVYPDFARLNDSKLLAADHWLGQLGVRQHQRRGLGLEFNQLREFREGDTLRQIDWKATARHRTPIARQYQDERDQQIIFLLDCGRRMRSQDDDLAHFDHALNACLLLSYVALRQGDAVGLMTFACDQPRYLAPLKGHAQLSSLLGSVYDLDSSQRPADFAAAATQLLARQKRRALVVLVTNLRDDDDEALLAAVKRIGQHHRILVASLRENLLDQLSQQPVHTWDDALTYCATVDYRNARQALHERLSAHGVALIDARPAELGAGLITRYLAWKKAGAL